MKTWFTGVLLTLLLASGVAHAEMRSVAVPTANFRSGPSEDAEIKFVGNMYFPVKVLETRDGWTKIKDFEGDSAWVASRLLSKTVAAVVIKSKRANIREKPSKKADIAFKVERGEVFKVLERDGEWLRVVDVNGEQGWVFDRLVWGMKDHKAIKDASGTKKASVKKGSEPKKKPDTQAAES